MPIQFARTANPDAAALTVIVDGEVRVFPRTHPRFVEIEAAAVAGDHEALAEAFLGSQDVVSVTGDLELRDGVGFYRGNRLTESLSAHVVRIVDEFGPDPEALDPFVRFLERLSRNPSATSRAHLHTWLESRDFTITPEGLIVGYKAVSGPKNLSMVSGSEEVLVDGKVHIGRIPYPAGAVVEMDRGLVDGDGDEACSVGLHVGTWDYAVSFGAGRPDASVLKVLVDPRDVVAVPRDSGGRKMRVARLTVVGAIPMVLTTPVDGEVRSRFYDGRSSEEYFRDLAAVQTDDEADDDGDEGCCCGTCC